MSIKKLFGSTDIDRNYLSDRDQKEAFKDVESERNLEQLKDKQTNFVPQVNYAKPDQFARFGSAYLYYKGAMERITDYYPYDGSAAEINKFYNQLVDVEKYIFDNQYPRTHGYVNLGAATGDGYSSVANYAVPTIKEYITLKGGPHALSTTATLVESVNDPYSDKFQYANVYDADLYTTEGLPSNYGVGTRQSNLQSNFDTGVAVEFWLKKPGYNYASPARPETIFDLWTSGSDSGSADYGRVTISLPYNFSGGNTDTYFLLTAQSGTAATAGGGVAMAAQPFQQQIGQNLGWPAAGNPVPATDASLEEWNHFAFVLYNTGSSFISKLYVNGTLNDTNTIANLTIGQLKQKDTFARLGALLTAPSGAIDSSLASQLDGASKLTGSIDEFRFWKEKRSAQDIGRYWFTQVRGGTNTDIANTTLGVYYKFNEGITGVSATDSTVLDYAGRITNGSWTGYGTNSRSTNSAILEASASIKEYKDPIIYSTNPDVSALKTQLLADGTYHDSTNNSMFVNYAPSWVLEDHDETENSNLHRISHIVGAYFDKAYLLCQQVPKLRGINYTSASLKPVPFAQHLPQSLGLYTPEVFIDANVMERFLDRTDSKVFESSLDETKNLIYLNLYNNLANIYKSKGTEKSLRNVLRCFNVDEKLIKVNTYAKNTTFPLSNNYEQLIEKKKYCDFNNNRTAVVYQRTNTANPESSGYITASTTQYEQKFGATIEAEVMFPFWDDRNYVDNPRNYSSVSLFGMTTPASSSEGLAGTDTSIQRYDPGAPSGWGGNYANFQVRAIKTSEQSKNVYFELSSSKAFDSAADNTYPFPTLTSSVFFDVYSNSTWNLSVRIKPKIDAPIIGLNGSTIAEYDVVFEGHHINLGSVANSFAVTGTVNATTGSNFLAAPKRLYIGAERTNLTGALIYNSDVLVSSARYWTKFLEAGTLSQHGYDVDNYGISGSYQNVGLRADGAMIAEKTDVLNLNTLALNWAFNQVTGSDSAGNFTVTDISSGSALLRDNYAEMGRIAGYQHSGYGSNFQASNTNAVDSRRVNTFKFIEPERATSADAIQILSEDDKAFGVTEVVPNYVYTVEKSMYRAISEEMLDFFAGVVDFNNLIGEPVNRYRDRYKSIEKLREIFFRRVTQTSKVEKFVNYYKWFDDAITMVMGQMVPASSDFVSDVYNTVESHVLERNKYQTKYPTLESQQPDPDSAITGYGELGYNYEKGSPTLRESPAPTNKHVKWWLERAKRTEAEITSGDATIDAQREIYRQVINSAPRPIQKTKTISQPDGTEYSLNFFAQRNFQKMYKLAFDKPTSTSLHGGVNFEPSKNIHFTYNSLYPFGPVNRTGGRFIPLNVLLGLTEDLVSIQDFIDDPGIPKKIKRVVKVQSGRDWEGGIGYANLKSTMAFPFNIISSSVNSGYNKEVIAGIGANVEITNLHNDVYGANMEVPMQGPFTEKYVGGHQSRHVALNKGTDTFRTRPEAWKLLVGECIDQGDGALGMTSQTYPYPDIATPPTNSRGTFRLIENDTLTSGDYVNVGDGDNTVKFEVPFENTKAFTFPSPSDAQGGMNVGGNQGGNETAPEPAEFFALSEATISSWISASAENHGMIWLAGNPHGTISFAHREGGDANKLRLTVRWNGGGGDSDNNDIYWQTDNAVVTPGVWQHAAVTYNANLSASMDPKFYVDGTLVDSTRGGGGWPSFTGATLKLQYQRYIDGDQSMPGGGLGVFVGGVQASNQFSGSLDEVSIWQLTMSAGQINELYDSGSVTNLFKHSLYLSASSNLYSWWRMGDDANDAISGTGSYAIGINSIVDQTSRANGNPRSANSIYFDTNVVTASAASGVTDWTKGGSVNASTVNLVNAINSSILNVAATNNGGGYAELENLKFGIATSTKRSARGSLGNTGGGGTGPTAWNGLSGGLDPVIINFRAPRATYYREDLAKRPVNIRTIQIKTGSTSIGNYRNNYDIVSSVGAFSNPRTFVENQPTLPSVITSQTNLNRGGQYRFEGAAASETVLNYLTRKRTANNHFDFNLDYTITENSGAFSNKSIIVSRFGAPGSRETMQRGIQDFRSSEFSVYNTLNNRNLTVRDAGGANEREGQTETAGFGYIVTDIHSRPIGLQQHLTRHSARFGRDSMIENDDDLPGASYDQLPAMFKVQRNTIQRLTEVEGGTVVTSSVFDNAYVQHQIPRSDRQYVWITSSLVSVGTNFGYLPAQYLMSTSVGGVEEPYQFLTASELGSYWSTTALSCVDTPITGGFFWNAGEGPFNSSTRISPLRTLGRPYGSGHFVPTDFVGLNFNIYEPLNTSTNMLGYALTEEIQDYINHGDDSSLMTTQRRGTFPPNAFVNDSSEIIYDLNCSFYANVGDENTTHLYNSPATLAGWYKLSTNFATASAAAPVVGDWSGNNRIGYVNALIHFDGDDSNNNITGSIPEWDSSVPSYKIASASSDFMSLHQKLVYLGPASSWDAIFGGAGSEKVTFSFWVNFKVLNGNASAVTPFFDPAINTVLKFGRNDVSPYNESLSVGVNKYGQLTMTTNFDAGSEITFWQMDNQVLSGDEGAGWHHYVLSFDGSSYSNPPTMYYNGTLQSITRTGDTPSAAWTGLEGTGLYTGSCQIGDNLDPAATKYGGAGYAPKFGGTVDMGIADVGIWTNILTAGEAGALYYASSGSFQTQTGRLPSNDAEILNSLLVHRDGPYGWPSWQQVRQQDHPIIRKEHQENVISVYTPDAGDNGTDFRKFDVSPVTLRGRPAKINYDIGSSQNVTVVATHNNAEIFFREPQADNYFGVSDELVVTPFEQIVKVTRTNNDTYSPNWILYSQNIIPSARNEGRSYSTQRTGYNNEYWRDDQRARVELGQTLSNSFGLLTYVPIPGLKTVAITQSSWMLDAPENFMTRTYAPSGGVGALTGTFANGAGELQNSYVMAKVPPAEITGEWFSQYLLPGALYSRKQLLGSPNSVVAPTGIDIPQTGTYTGSLDPAEQVEIFAGEAEWLAPSQAGITIKSASLPVFQSHPVDPWFDNYTDFKYEPRLMAKDYQIVPEFRISEHIQDFKKYGLVDTHNADIFEIPGTGINSANSSSFYKDYSNSEFLKGFLGVKETSGLNATEIQLECNALIRFNPYKGFYPAQRSLQLVSQFSSSYFDSLAGFYKDLAADQRTGSYGEELLKVGGIMRPLFASLFAPGIMYNSIKSGIAVDYPILTNPQKAQSVKFGDNTGEYALTINPEGLKVGLYDQTGYDGGDFWDLRVPFDGIIKPEKYLMGLKIVDAESHPSASLLNNSTASMVQGPGDELYSAMASNYFAEIMNFFCADAKPTRLESRVMSDDLRFETGSVYTGMIKLRKSTRGSRNYLNEIDSLGRVGAGSSYSTFGAENSSSAGLVSGAFYPLPQDPRFQTGFQETFTLYSRPTAFGPPCAAMRISGSSNYAQTALEESTYRPMDSFNGYNWSFTPPYYDGESWAHLVFRPDSSKSYDIPQILAETDIVYWRHDAGYTASLSFTGTMTEAMTDNAAYTGDVYGIYNGTNINSNAMQISASIDLLGIEKAQFIEKDKFGNPVQTRNTSVGSKWVIQPKFETPHVNFNSVSASMPLFASASVPRGVWHQFGTIPTDANTGIFLEIDDIPIDWIRNHYKVIYENSVYNNNTILQGKNLYKNNKSLKDLFGFKETGDSKRLGQFADAQTLREAIVAIPYITEQVEDDYGTINPDLAQFRKKFIDIPTERFDAALDEQQGSEEGDSLETAGGSIRKLIQKMDRYVLPPQFDFLNNRNVDPIVMYLFEFEYKLDRDDLSYIWQNLAPRKYQQITYQKSSVAHELMDTELLSQDNVLNNQNLRWMVFKVKQRSQKIYDEMIVAQAGEANRDDFIQDQNTDPAYKISYNWPYDFVSFVEMIKIDAKVLFGGRSTGTPGARVPRNLEVTSPVLEAPGGQSVLPTTVSGITAEVSARATSLPAATRATRATGRSTTPTPARSSGTSRISGARRSGRRSGGGGKGY